MVKKCAQHWSNKSGQTDILQWLIATQDHLSRLRQTEVWIEQWIMNNELMERIFNIEMSEISMEQSKPSIWPDCLNLRKPICQGLAKVLESKSFHAKGNQVYHHYFPSLTIVWMVYSNILFPFRSPQNSSAVRRSKSRGWRKIVAPKLLSHQQLPVNHHHHHHHHLHHQNGWYRNCGFCYFVKQ